MIPQLNLEAFHTSTPLKPCLISTLKFTLLVTSIMLFIVLYYFNIASSITSVPQNEMLISILYTCPYKYGGISGR